MSIKKIPTTEDVLAFIPKGRAISLSEWNKSMEIEGYDTILTKRILQRLLDPEDMNKIDLDRDMKLIWR